MNVSKVTASAVSSILILLDFQFNQLGYTLLLDLAWQMCLHNIYVQNKNISTGSANSKGNRKKSKRKI